MSAARGKEHVASIGSGEPAPFVLALGIFSKMVTASFLTERGIPLVNLTLSD